MKGFNKEDLDNFDRITKLENSRYQMDRIDARIEWKMWVKEHEWDKEALDEMREELIRQGRW